MTTNVGRIKNNLKNIFDLTEPFFFGYGFPILVGLLTAFFWYLGISAISIFVFSMFGLYIFVAYRDSSPILPLLFGISISFSSLDRLANFTEFLYFTPALIGLVLHFILHPIKKIKIGKLFFPLLVIFFVMSIAGLGSSYYLGFSSGLATIFGVGLSTIIVYLYFKQYIGEKKNFRFDKYLCITIISIAGAVSIQLFNLHFLKWSGVDVNKVNIHFFGWGYSTQIGTLFLLAYPCTFYLMVKDKIVLPYLFIGLFFIIIIFLSAVDGPAALLCFGTPILMIYTHNRLNDKNKRIFWNFYGFALLILCTTIIIFLDELMPIFNHLFNSFLDDTGRTQIYLKAIEIFKAFPFLGGGFATHPGQVGLIPYNYHSTFFQILATMGIVGLIGYALYYFVRIKLLTKNYKDVNIYFTISFILFESYAMIDCAEFNGIPLMIILTVMMVCIEFANDKNKFNDEELPLFMKTKYLSHR